MTLLERDRSSLKGRMESIANATDSEGTALCYVLCIILVTSDRTFDIR